MEINNFNKYVKSLKSQPINSFKLTQLKMDFENDNLLKVQLKAPLLNNGNYKVDISNGILTLKVMIAKIESNFGVVKKKPVFVESFLVLPSSEFSELLNAKFHNNELIITIAKNNDMPFVSRTNVAGVA
ncbi:hypothetical protein FUA26_09695 [Seonamhaeicola algicola]|uniref:Hsp20/alpha crystallin family protein n=1 Tax=Seonamhaeicola algicola TaxID=1719036 RepID=A0A5C7AN48_9FLAO|nr:hypothetical protein [Seonamhaeicola algicola]TXE09751.1 hypothetical protein FUA26_09695 [Seonamhaeicola algicola]